MAGHIDKKEVIYVLLIVSFVFGVFFFYKGQYFLNDFMQASGQSRTTVMAGKRAQDSQKFQKAIESSLNDLLDDVFLEMQEYKKRRKILDDLMGAENFRDTKYIIGTYEIGIGTISDLRERSDAIIKIFSNKDAELKKMIQGRSASAQQNILKAWSRVKSQQVALYVNYFNLEQSVLERHGQLLALYFKNRNDVVYYPEAKQVVFQSQALNSQAIKLDQDIKVLKQRQANLTK